MKSSCLMLVTIIFAGIILSGCNFADIFSKLATSNLEQGAQEEFAQGKIIEAKQRTIDQKKQQFSTWIELKNVNESTGYIAYAFLKPVGESTQIDIEAMLPNPDHQAYEVWLRGETAQDKIKLGLLKFNQTDDYSLSYTAKIDSQAYKTVLLSREANFDDKPETIIMTGALNSVATTSAVTPEK